MHQVRLLELFKEVVFKGLLVLQDTNLVPGYVGPIIY